ncbi:MAG: Lrp/AsnC family transcriptional regulator [Bacteroidia bacterium]|nr:Lrp/AsnC family transcriptional regulator [Bacteroidia bacterium]
MLNLDNIDQEILNSLDKDGRISYSALAKKVNLTSAAVGQRVQRMIQDEVILGFGTHINREKIGLSIQAVINLKLNFARIHDFNKVLCNYDEIEYCYRVTGEDCIIMKVNVRDNKHLLKFIDRISDYGHTKSSIILEKMV